jgi:hypothetical protein
MEFPRAATTETTMNGLRNSRLWPADRFVFTDDFAPSIVTDRPQTIQLEKATADGIENFCLTSAHGAKSATPGHNGYIPIEKISPLI